MKTTTNLGLKKPEAEDFYSVDDMNYNSDKIDEKIGEISNIKESTYTKQEVETKLTELENSIDTDIEILETQFSNALSLKADKSTILSGTLSIGETSISFTNDVLTEDSIIDIYTDVYGVSPKEVSSSIGSLTLTFDAQTVAVNIKVVVS